MQNCSQLFCHQIYCSEWKKSMEFLQRKNIAARCHWYQQHSFHNTHIDLLYWQDLIKYTPTGHADYDLLQKTLTLARSFLDNLVAPEIDRDNVWLVCCLLDIVLIIICAFLWDCLPHVVQTVSLQPNPQCLVNMEIDFVWIQTSRAATAVVVMVFIGVDAINALMLLRTVCRFALFGKCAAQVWNCTCAICKLLTLSLIHISEPTRPY